MKLFGKKIDLKKTFKNIAATAVKVQATVQKVVAPVIKAVIPGSAKVVDKVTDFTGKLADRIKTSSNAVTNNPQITSVIENVEEHFSDGSGSLDSVSDRNSGGGGSNNSLVKRSVQSDSDDDSDEPEVQVKVSKFTKLLAIGFGIWQLTKSK
jgi:hypothetical protein